MPGLKPAAGLRAILAGACAITWISAAHPAIAQSLNDVCRIGGGGGQTCTVNPAPVGSLCGCFTPSGRVTGRVEQPTASKGDAKEGTQKSDVKEGTQKSDAKEGPQTSSVCKTAYGLCRAKTTRKVGEACDCYGDAGALIAVPSSR
jgi:hypothetical protein